MNQKKPNYLAGIISSLMLMLPIKILAVQQIDTPIATPRGVFSNEPANVIVTAQVAVDFNLLPTSVNLVRKTPSGQLLVLGRMYDDGTHGDALRGDQTFTIQFQLNEPNPGFVEVYSSSAYRGQRNRVISSVTKIIVSKRPNDEQLNAATNVPIQAKQKFELRRSQVGAELARSEILAELATEPQVASFGLSTDGFYIWIVFKGGLKGGISTAPPGTK